MKKDNERFRILIVDDVPKNIQVAANILQRQGYHMAFAQNGKAALAQIRANRFDLVLLDIMMPEMDGFEATQMIRNPESSVLDHNIPIIAMTAHAMKGAREKCLNAGMNDYITKPIEISNLCHTLSRWLLKRGRHFEQIFTDSEIDMEEMLEKLGGNRDLFIRILEKFYANYFILF